MSAGYAELAARLGAGGLVADAWYDGQARFDARPLALRRGDHAQLIACAEAVAALHDELARIVLAEPALLDAFFGLTEAQKLMWGLSAPAWHGVARADVFLTADGPRCCELNSDTPSGQSDALALGDALGLRGDEDPNRALEARFMGLVATAAAGVAPAADPPCVGIIYPTELTEDLGLVTLYRRWLEARGARVVLGSPHNLRLARDGRVVLFGTPCHVLLRHYKTDWWGEREPVWTDVAPPPDAAPLLEALRVIVAATLRRRVAVVNPFGAVLAQNKRALAFFWEERARFSPAAQDAIARHLPFAVRLERADLAALERERADWVLKSDYGCEGDEVIVGAEVEPEVWRRALALAVPRRFIAQRRFEPRRDDEGRAVNFGVYLVAGRAAGLYCRRSAQATDAAAVSVAARLTDEGEPWTPKPETPLVAGGGTPFVRRFYAAREDLIAARWWQVDMEPPLSEFTWLPSNPMPVGEEDVSRRALLIVVGGGFAIAAIAAIVNPNDEDDDEGITVSTDALELQRSKGWDVLASTRLSFRGSTGLNVAGRSDWAMDLDELAGILMPAQEALQPYAVWTLFQVLSSPSFRAALFPVSTPDTAVAFAVGQALAALFRDPAATPGTAIVIDMAGAEAVAAAAGLSGTFEPVFLFDNWPHPDGVVPSHEVIGAAVYYQPVFAAERADRANRAFGAQVAPPAFVLDRWRLNPYVDAPDKFDNRYLARLPSARGLKDLNVQRILYLTDAPTLQEADDLNDDFVAFTEAGIEIKIVSVADFRPADPGQPYVVTYGGMQQHHTWFWHSYGSTPGPRPRAEIPPARLSEGATYRPQPRATIFSSRVVGGAAGVGRQRPTGFGRVSVRTAGPTGAVIGRSGSFGRGGSRWGG